jgi:hypothetical protein
LKKNSRKAKLGIQSAERRHQKIGEFGEKRQFLKKRLLCGRKPAIIRGLVFGAWWLDWRYISEN